MAAVEQLTLSLEDEREQIKALKRKHMSNTKDLQRQIAHCKRFTCTQYSVHSMHIQSLCV